MSRDRYRVCLQDGLKLDLNRLSAQGVVRRGCVTGPVGFRWVSDYWGEVASALIWADMTSDREGYFRIRLGEREQQIILSAKPRHFGGRQWYFVCPYLNQHVSVLWKPPGAHYFACRQKWGRQVAYASQFMTRDARAHHGKAKINARLCRKGGFNSDDWDLPPKPKWMRWRTYNSAVAKYDRYEDDLDEGLAALVARLSGI
jgi:hypothetical protein